MEDIEKYKELIPAYLSGKIDPVDREAFETRLRDNQQLQDELVELRQMQMGLTILEAVCGGHIDSELLVKYASVPDDIDEETRDEVKSHLEVCEQCQEELHMCQHAMPGVVEKFRESKQNLVITILNWLVTPRLVMRPVYVAVTLLILVLPLAYVSLQRGIDEMSVAAYEIVPAGARDLRSVNDIVITPDIELVELRFVLPVLEDRRYDFELYDVDQRLVFARYDNPPQKAFDLKLQSSDLVNGIYILRVKELADRQERNRFDFRLRVHHSGN